MTAIRSLAFDESASPCQLFETVLRYIPDSRVRDRILELVAVPEERTIADASHLIASWRSNNAKAMGAMTEVAREKDMELHYLPEQRATEWWRYMHVRQEIEDAMTDNIFVPSPLILMNPAKQPFTMNLWPNGYRPVLSAV